MSIPSNQLDTWSNPGADDSAKTTQRRVSNVLDSDNSIPVQKDKDLNVFLQGSYKNSTNIYADSDVDLVVKLESTYHRDLSQLSSTQKSEYKSWTSKASYGWEEFHEDVTKTLRKKYGANAVSVEDRAVVLDSDSLPLPADILVCQQYRRYKRFRSSSDQDYYEGVVFWDRSTDEKIVSYPKIHFSNGADKNDDTHKRFRETVRIFKNARSYLVDKNEIEEGLAPSYFIECLLYNVPSGKYDHGLKNRYQSVVNWLVNNEIDGFHCQNEIQDLFGNKSTQWSTSDANRFIKELVELWNNWYSY